MTSDFDNQQLKETDKKLSAFVNSRSCTDVFGGFNWLPDIAYFSLTNFVLLRKGDWLLAVVFSNIFLGILIYKHLALRAYKKRVAKSELLQKAIFKILQGPPELEKIYSNTLLPWRWLFLMSRPKNFSDWVLLVAQNLSWYQNEPKLFMPIRWIVQTALFIALFSATIAGDINNQIMESGYVFLVSIFTFFPFFYLVGLGVEMKMEGAKLLQVEIQTLLDE